MQALLVEGQRSRIFRPFDVEVCSARIFGVLSMVYRWTHHVAMPVEPIADEVFDFILAGIAVPEAHALRPNALNAADHRRDRSAGTRAAALRSSRMPG